MRFGKIEHLRNERMLLEFTGLNSDCLLRTINSCYRTLDHIDTQLVAQNIPPIANLVELANLSSMVGNIIGAGLAANSNGAYIRNRPHAYPDLIPARVGGRELELKMALETNKPKGHLPKAGNYMTIRYVLGNSNGHFAPGKEFRGDTVWIWEIKIGYLSVNDFSISNTEGDSGKTAVITSAAHNNMSLVYFAPEFLPYKSRAGNIYPGYN